MWIPPTNCPVKFGGYRPGWREDILSLICHVTSSEAVIRGLYNFVGKIPLPSPHCEFGGHTPCERGDVKFLICHLTSSDYMIRGLCHFMHGFPSS